MSRRAVAELLGREDVLSSLERSLEALPRSGGGVVLVEGEAGIGKTAILGALADAARARGCRVFRGTCAVLEQTRPFGALVDALQSHEEAAGALDLIASVDEAIDMRRHAIIDAAIDFLGVISLRQPAVLILDDLQWADTSTLAFVEQMSRRLSHDPVLLVAAMRPLPRSSALSAVTTGVLDRGGTLVQVGPLDEGHARALVASILDAEVSPELDVMISGAGGNPFYVLELLASLQDDRTISVTDGRAQVGETRVPGALRFTILRRLATLPPATLETLRIASILGRTFSVADLAVCSGHPPADLLWRLQPALDARFLGEEGDELGFRHDLVREALYEDLPGSARSALHLQAGEALAAAAASSLTVAMHLTLGGAAGDVAAGWFEQAALESSDAIIAADLMLEALRLTEPGDGARLRRLPMVIRALNIAARFEDAQQVARREVGPHWREPAAFESRLLLAGGLMLSGAIGAALTEMDELLSVEQIDDHLRLAAVAAWSSMLIHVRDTALVKAGAARVLEADSVPRPLHARSIANLAWVAHFEGHPLTALDLIERADALARDESIEVAEDLAADVDAIVMGLRADRPEVPARVLGSWGPLDDSSDTFRQIAKAHHSFVTGDWDRAAVEAETYSTIVRDLGDVWYAPYALAIQAHIAFQRDDLRLAGMLQAEVEDLLIRSPGRHGLVLAMITRALMLSDGGDPVAAREILAGIMSINDVLGAVGDNLDVLPHLVRLGSETADAGTVERVCSHATMLAERMKTPTSIGIARLCGGLAVEDADLVLQAADLMDQGCDAFAAARARAEAGLALARASRLDEARANLNAAIRSFERMGASRPLARLETEMRACGVRAQRPVRRQRAATGWESLTPMETEVVQLVAEGLTNPQIGQRLFISRRTVETHLSHVFDKLGMRTRAQLAVAVARRHAEPQGPLGSPGGTSVS